MTMKSDTRHAERGRLMTRTAVVRLMLVAAWQPHGVEGLPSADVELEPATGLLASEMLLGAWRAQRGLARRGGPGRGVPAWPTQRSPCLRDSTPQATTPHSRAGPPGGSPRTRVGRALTFWAEPAATVSKRIDHVRPL